jgi:hypothetical protein
MTDTDAISSAGTAKWRKTRAFPWILKLLVSVALIWYLFAKIGLAGALERAASLPVPSLVGAFFLILAQAILGGVRWRFVIAAIGGQLDVLKAVLITFVSLFFNQFLPASVGADLVRMWQSNRAGLSLPTAVTSVVLERFGNFLCVVAMALAALPAWTRHVHGEAARSAFIVAGIVGALSLVTLMFLDRLPERWRHWRIVRALVLLARDVRLLFLHPGYATLLLVTAIVGQVVLAGAVYMLASGLGLSVIFTDCLIVMPAVVLITSLPISVAGWGVREFAMVSAFSMLAVPAESALALSVVLALTGTAASLPGGVIWLWSRSGGSLRLRKASKKPR